VLLIVAGVAACLVVGGAMGAQFVKSPAELEAQTASPPANLLTAPVADEVVSDVAVMRGTVSEPHEYHATPTSELGASALVVTKIYKPAGSVVQSGAVIAEVSGRPLFVLRGSIPVYRNIAPGDRGDDVAELQQALDQLGFSTSGDAVGYYGWETKRAVADFYASVGYQPAEAGDAAAVEAAKATVMQDESSLASLKTQALNKNSSGGNTHGGVPIRALIIQAQGSLAAAVTAERAASAASGAMVPYSEVMFVPSLPATVLSIAGSVGASPEEPFVTLASGTPDVLAQLDPSERGEIHSGMTAEIQDQVTGFDTTGVINTVSRATSSENSVSGAPYVPITIEPEKAVPPSEIGQDVQVTIESARSRGRVLAVPVSAVFSRADGSTYVTVVTAAGSQREVLIHVLLVGSVAVGIEPIEAGSLKAGDIVVTGVDNVPKASSTIGSSGPTGLG
jgi:HlyD family secretion protein